VKQADWAVVFVDGLGREECLPTPRLVDEATGGKIVEAYRDREADEQYPAMWRVRDDSYDPPGTKYVNVTLRRIG
jgi:hypothetical protein